MFSFPPPPIGISVIVSLLDNESDLYRKSSLRRAPMAATCNQMFGCWNTICSWPFPRHLILQILNLPNYAVEVTAIYIWFLPAPFLGLAITLVHRGTW